jgi:hypothetical protein
MKPYRTIPPPLRGNLVKWAVYEAAAWPRTTPQGESYTWWIRFAEKTRRTLQQTRMEF